MAARLEHHTNKWIVAVTVMFGAFIAVMDISVVNVALPHMMGTFGESLSEITWVATSYSIAEIIMVSMAGWLSTLLGRKRLYLLSFALFTLGSVLCGTSSSFHEMMLFRVIQGIGGGSLIPVSQAILREAFPHEEQSTAMAFYGMGVVLAPAVGPIVGGWLTDHYGWPWIFYINVPFSLVGMIMVWFFVHDPHYLRRGVRRIDWQGILLLAVTLTGLQLVLERGEQVDWFSSRLIVAGTIITLIAAVLLIWREFKAEHPIMNLRLLKDIPLSVSSIMTMVFGMGLFGSTFILPQFTQDLLGYPAYKAGLVLAPRAFMLFAMMPLAGWLYKWIDARILIAAGTIILVWSYYDLSGLSLQADFWTLVPILLLMGMGSPFMFVTMTTLALSNMDRRDMTDASSLYTLARRIGGNVGYALTATLVTRGIQTSRVSLVDNVTPEHPTYQLYHSHLSTILKQAGVAASAVSQRADALINHMINRQATMLSYNHLSIVLGLLTAAMIPLVFLLPGRGRATEIDVGE